MSENTLHAKKYYDPQKKRMLFFQEEATQEFWDHLWHKESLNPSREEWEQDRFVAPTTSTYIRPSKEKKILEGGCGRGQFVYSLDQRGYDAYGLDFAPQTISAIQKMFPTLKVQQGDVRSLPYQDNFFDGYWSLGVVEHFFDGYSAIAQEMARVIKPQGYLFLTFPSMSPLRRWKARFGLYPLFSSEKPTSEHFYQFALPTERVIQDFSQLGFTLIKERRLDGIKGMKDEIHLLNRPLQSLYKSKNILAKVLVALLSRFSAPLAGHSSLLVFQKSL